MARSAVPMALAVAVLAGCGAGGASFKHENTPDNLKALGQALRTAATGDQKTALALTKSLLPDEPRLRKALIDGTSSGVVQKLLAGHKQMSSDESQLAKAFVVEAEKSEVQVHAATTEQLRAYASGSTAFEEFPGGAKTLAEQILRPATTFYEVEFVKPGETSGMKYHLFYWTARGGRCWGRCGAS